MSAENNYKDALRILNYLSIAGECGVGVEIKRTGTSTPNDSFQFSFHFKEDYKIINLPPAFGEQDWVWSDIEWSLQDTLDEKKKQDELQAKRRLALSKLSPEEIELLGINRY